MGTLPDFRTFPPDDLLRLFRCQRGYLQGYKTSEIASVAICGRSCHIMPVLKGHEPGSSGGHMHDIVWKWVSSVVFWELYTQLSCIKILWSPVLAASVHAVNQQKAGCTKIVIAGFPCNSWMDVRLIWWRSTQISEQPGFWISKIWDGEISKFFVYIFFFLNSHKVIHLKMIGDLVFK